MAVFTGNGSAGSPSFTFSSDTDTGMYRVGADTLALTTAGTARLTIGADGGSSIFANSTNPALLINQVGTGNAFTVEDSANPDSTPLVVDNTGRLVVGDTESRFFATVIPKSQIIGTGGGNALGIANWTPLGPQDPARIYLARSRSSTPGTYSAVQNGDSLGLVAFMGDEGTQFRPGANIIGRSDSNWTVGSTPCSIYLETCDASSTNPEARFRVDENGRVVSSLEGFLEPTTLESVSNTIIPISQVKGTTGATSGFMCVNANDLAGSGPAVHLARTRGTNPNNNVVVQDGDICGAISFWGADGTEYANSAQIRVNVDAPVTGPGANTCGGEIELRTTADGGAGPSISQLIRNDGAVYFPRISTTASAANAFLDSGTSNSLLRSTSSIKYKTDVEDLWNSISEEVYSLRPVWYRSTAEADRSDWSWYGLIAEEVAEVDPRLVHWGYSAEDYEEITVDEGDGPVVKSVLKSGVEPKPEGVQYERLTVLLIGVIKDLTDRIAALEAK